MGFRSTATTLTESQKAQPLDYKSSEDEKST